MGNNTAQAIFKVPAWKASTWCIYASPADCITNVYCLIDMGKLPAVCAYIPVLTELTVSSCWVSCDIGFRLECGFLRESVVCLSFLGLFLHLIKCFSYKIILKLFFIISRLARDRPYASGSFFDVMQKSQEPPGWFARSLTCIKRARPFSSTSSCGSSWANSFSREKKKNVFGRFESMRANHFGENTRNMMFIHACL